METLGKLASKLYHSLPTSVFIRNNLLVNSVVKLFSIFFSMLNSIKNYMLSIVCRRHTVFVTTGDKEAAGTKANVFMVMYDEKNKASPPMKFGNFLKICYLERATTQCYRGPVVGNKFRHLDKIEIRMDEGGDDPWYCDVIEVHDKKTNEKHAFPVQSWVKPGEKVPIFMQQTTLPQDDKFPEARTAYLDRKRSMYEYERKFSAYPGLPMQIKKLPAEEVLSFKYGFGLASVAAAATIHNFIEKVLDFLKSAPDRNIEDIRHLFNSNSFFPKPRAVDYYNCDVWFAGRKLAGTNPCQIELCKQVPDKFEVTDEMVRGFLGDKTLSQAAEENRLFIIDYSIVEGLTVTKPGVEFPAPMALFFLDSRRILRPIAIQLQQTPGPENPVFLPNDDANLWILAKMWFNLADSMVHQSLSHLGFTHLLMEGICINTHRNLAINHPVFRLLAHHFLYLLAINDMAVKKLLGPDGYVEKTMQCGVKGMQELVLKGFERYRFNIDGCLPEQIKHRGMDSVDVIADYPYRDDGLPVYYAIEKYVLSILNHYYDTTDKLINDKEIQAWGREMVAPKPDGLDLKGIPNNGEFEKIEDLCMIITGIIFTCSAQHAAVNFLQYEEYAFPPNYPACLNAKLPRNKTDKIQKQDLVRILGNQSITLDTMTVIKILSQRATKSLGDWEVACWHDKFALKKEKAFQEDLKKITKDIKERNLTRSNLLEYHLLDPVNIPNAISI